MEYCVSSVEDILAFCSDAIKFTEIQIAAVCAAVIKGTVCDFYLILKDLLTFTRVILHIVILKVESTSCRNFFFDIF